MKKTGIWIYMAGEVIGIILGLLIYFGMCFWAGLIAKRKGRSFGGFFALTFFLGIFGIIIAACVRSEYHRTSEAMNNYNKDNDTWVCKRCGKSNYGGMFCQNCGTRKGLDR